MPSKVINVLKIAVTIFIENNSILMIQKICKMNNYNHECKI